MAEIFKARSSWLSGSGSGVAGAMKLRFLSNLWITPLPFFFSITSFTRTVKGEGFLTREGNASLTTPNKHTLQGSAAAGETVLERPVMALTSPVVEAASPPTPCQARVCPRHPRSAD